MGDEFVVMDPRAVELGLLANHAEFERGVVQRLLERAREKLDADDLSGAVALVSAAAGHRWLEHTGDLDSTNHDQVIERLAVAAGPWPTTGGRAPRPRVLHVLSEAYATGGHTRVVWRWVSAVADVSQDVVLVHQRGDAPADLGAALVEAGGRLFNLQGGLHDKVRALRSLAAEADAVVLHIHPDDAVTLTALAHPHRATPLLLFNHADHVFWLGASLVDEVICFRRSSLSSCERRRGVSPGRLRLLPLPLDGREAREGALRQDRLLVTVASSYKYAVNGGLSLQGLIGEYLAADPGASAVVVGPRPGDHHWAALETTHPGRVKLTGVLQDVTPVVSQASLYLDSYPFTSITSWLEAALSGIPVLALRPPELQGRTVSGDDPADAHVISAASGGEWLAAVSSVLGDVERASTIGQALRADVRKAHWTDWSSTCRRMISEARLVERRRRRLSPSEQVPDAGDLVIWRSHRVGGQAQPLEATLRAHAVADDVRQFYDSSSQSALTVVLGVWGGAEVVLSSAGEVLESFGHLGVLDVHFVDLGLTEDGRWACSQLRQVGRVMPPQLSKSVQQRWVEAGESAASEVLIFISCDVIFDRLAVEMCLEQVLNLPPGLIVRTATEGMGTGGAAWSPDLRSGAFHFMTRETFRRPGAARTVVVDGGQTGRREVADTSEALLPRAP